MRSAGEAVADAPYGANGGYSGEGREIIHAPERRSKA